VASMYPKGKRVAFGHPQVCAIATSLGEKFPEM